MNDTLARLAGRDIWAVDVFVRRIVELMTAAEADALVAAVSPDAVATCTLAVEALPGGSVVLSQVRDLLTIGEFGQNVEGGTLVLQYDAGIIWADMLPSRAGNPSEQMEAALAECRLTSGVTHGRIIPSHGRLLSRMCPMIEIIGTDEDAEAA